MRHCSPKHHTLSPYVQHNTNITSFPFLHKSRLTECVSVLNVVDHLEMKQFMCTIKARDKCNIKRSVGWLAIWRVCAVSVGCSGQWALRWYSFTSYTTLWMMLFVGTVCMLFVSLPAFLSCSEKYILLKLSLNVYSTPYTHIWMTYNIWQNVQYKTEHTAWNTVSHNAMYSNWPSITSVMKEINISRNLILRLHAKKFKIFSLKNWIESAVFISEIYMNIIISYKYISEIYNKIIMFEIFIVA